MEKTLDYGSFGVDDGPNCLSNIPDEVLAAIDEEERRNPPATWKEAWERSINREIRDQPHVCGEHVSTASDSPG